MGKYIFDQIKLKGRLKTNETLKLLREAGCDTFVYDPVMNCNVFLCKRKPEDIKEIGLEWKEVQ